MKPQQDRFARSIDYLRISVTDRCNLRCGYCMPAEGIASRAHEQILRYEEIATVARVAAGLGVTHIRLTGGEPLVRLGIVDLVRLLALIPGIDDLAMTTNGTLLAGCAQQLAGAGLRRVNISLDTLDPQQYQQITRRGHLADALDGIRAARAAGLAPVKINAVIIRGMNDDQILPLAAQAMSDGWHLRFIEWMPLGAATMPSADWRQPVVTGAEIRGAIEDAFGPLQPDDSLAGAGPARTWRLPGAAGSIGFITPVSDHFCASCNRLRLTADGQLRPCLLANQEIDLRAALRRGADEMEIRELLLQAIALKPQCHHLSSPEPVSGRLMSQIGG